MQWQVGVLYMGTLMNVFCGTWVSKVWVFEHGCMCGMAHGCSTFWSLMEIRYMGFMKFDHFSEHMFDSVFFFSF